MGVWVRRQDREEIAEVSDIWVKEDFDIVEKGFWRRFELVPNGKFYIKSDKGNLGSYNSNERALKVLDDIQKFIFEKSNISKVYKMPAE